MLARARTEADDLQSAAGQPPGAPATRGPRVPSALRRALDALEESEVSWALLRGESELGSTGEDVDVLASPSDLRRLALVLAPLGYVRLPSHGRGSHSFFVTYDHADDSWVKLDVVTDLAFGRYQELALEGAGGCLERRRRVGEAVLLAADDAFWTLLLHCLLDACTFREAHRRSLLALAADASATGPLAEALERAVGDGWAATMLALAKTGEWAALESLAPSLWAAWRHRRPLTTASTRLKNAALRRAGRFPPLSSHGLVLRAQPSDATLAAEVTDRWFLPSRRIGSDGSAQLRDAAVARWHAARGRLVLVEPGAPVAASRWVDRVSGASDFRSVAGLGSSKGSIPAATAGIWRWFTERTGA